MTEEMTAIAAEDLRQKTDRDLLKHISSLLGVDVTHMDSYQVIEKLSEQGISFILAVKGGEGMELCAEFWKEGKLLDSLDIQFEAD